MAVNLVKVNGQSMWVEIHKLFGRDGLLQNCKQWDERIPKDYRWSTSENRTESGEHDTYLDREIEADRLRN